MEKIKVGIIGATGYAGEELVRLLYQHPQAQLVSLASHSYAGQPYSGIYPNYREIQDVLCDPEDIEPLAEKADVIFLALPHGLASSKVTAQILEQCKVIDLGADFACRMYRFMRNGIRCPMKARRFCRRRSMACVNGIGMPSVRQVWWRIQDAIRPAVS